MIVHYPLKKMHDFSSHAFDARTAEVREIRDWLDNFLYWDASRYSVKYHSSGQAMVIWFDRDEDAAFFILRWL